MELREASGIGGEEQLGGRGRSGMEGQTVTGKQTTRGAEKGRGRRGNVRQGCGQEGPANKLRGEGVHGDDTAVAMTTVRGSGGDSSKGGRAQRYRGKAREAQTRETAGT
eukprot:CAMPEP_0117672190 /NCGR_PEP_ID=MMETSP0804-20121206/13763_1 /TAXON_ID=1074897 /ORGANISM="Tetraselmis astigmatica, Strain CCMP880" /LENGTH=108 /DNA_ID=CAMNT_0005480757 /DNA_START=440 /DNA_END=762 /DNA_ORIENTATION=-